VVKFTRKAVGATSEEKPQVDWQKPLAERIEQCRRQFGGQPVTPETSRDMEKQIKAALDQAGRTIMQESLSGQEPSNKQHAAPRVRYRGDTYRINKSTPCQVATIFGTITVWSFLYLNEQDGEPGLHPLHVRLGLVAGGATVLLAERVARAAVDFSQSEVRRWLESEHGLRWSNDRLRRVVRAFRNTVVAFRAEAQAARLLFWLDVAQRSRGRHRPVLAVGRDGVMVPIRGHAYQEASAATVSVYDRRGKRLGTVYLGQMPEAYQKAMTKELTDLVQGVLAAWSGPTPRLVYVTDKGQASEDYFRRVLRRMKDPHRPSRRLAWEWVIDYFHVCGYVSKLREALFGECGQQWAKRMRHWLKHRQHGAANVLRSAMQHFHRRAMTKKSQTAFWKAYNYLRRNSHWMDFAGARRQGLPIGSGVTEAACKTVFTQRLKRSGMRWHKESGQVIVDLRVLHLSGIWDEVVRRDLRSRCLPKPVKGLSHQRRTMQTANKAA
jgi:hypothetical protein